jgi:hypothetical protein
MFGFTLEEATAAFRILSRVGTTATEAANAIEESMRALAKAEESMTSYTIGRVTKVTIETSTGEEIELEHVDLRVEIEQERMNHYSRIGGDRVTRQSEVVGENISVTLDVTANEAEELTRLIRED